MSGRGSVARECAQSRQYIPSFEEGSLGPSRKMERYRRQGTAEEVRHLFNLDMCLTSPVAPRLR
jgi:hypothetical protein